MKQLLDGVLIPNSFWEILIFTSIIFVIAWLISKVIRFFIVQYIQRKQKDTYGTTSIRFVKNSIKFFVFFLAFIYIIMTVPVLRKEATLIFSGAGILAAIIGFAAQAAVSNLIAGVFIVIFKPFRVGDYIKLDEERIGIVQDITLRHTVINNFENKRLIIPNSVISTESVLNHTIDDSMILSFNNYKIGLNANINLAKKIIQEEAVKLDYVIDNRTPKEILTNKDQIEVRVVDVTENFIHLRAYVWLNEPFEEFKFKCLLRENVHNRFIDEKVDLPIPIRQIIN